MDLENQEKAMLIKNLGNEFFLKNQFPQAIFKYAEAIQVLGDVKETAPILCNRSLCHIKMENFGAALIDANKAIEMNPKFVKGYYRKSSAYVGLN